MKLARLLPLSLVVAIVGCSQPENATPHPDPNVGMSAQDKIKKIQSDPTIPDGLKKIQTDTLSKQHGG